MPRTLEFNGGPMDGQTMQVADGTPQVAEMVFVTPTQGEGDTDDRWTWQTRHKYVCYVSSEDFDRPGPPCDYFEYHSSEREKVGQGGIDAFDDAKPAPIMPA